MTLAEPIQYSEEANWTIDNYATTNANLWVTEKAYCIPQAPNKGLFGKNVRYEGGSGYPRKRTKRYKGEGDSSKDVSALM